MTVEQVKEYVYNILENERKKGNKIRKIDELIEYYQKYSCTPKLTQDKELQKSSPLFEAFFESAKEITELENMRKKYTSPSPEFLQLLSYLDPLEYSIVFGFYANGKSFNEIALSYMSSNMNVPNINTLKTIKRRAINKIINSMQLETKQPQ